jgi:hypothetical protein
MKAVKPSSRPLKCKLCSRRFKYAVCMKDHLKKDHMKQLMETMQQAYIQRLAAVTQAINTIKNEQQIQKPIQQPVRVSVIRSNNFSKFVAV